MLPLNNFPDYLALWLILSASVGVPYFFYGQNKGRDISDAMGEITAAAFWACVITWAVRRLFF